MLFSEEEIDQLHYLKKLAIPLNETYSHIKERPESHLTFSNSTIEKEIFYSDMKTNILYVDNLFQSIGTPLFQDLTSHYVNNIFTSLNSIFLRFVTGKLGYKEFLDNYFFVFYSFFDNVKSHSLFGSNYSFNYSTSFDFDQYVVFLGNFFELISNEDIDINLSKKFFILENKFNELADQNLKNNNIFEKSLNRFISEQKSFYDDKVDKIIKSFKLLTDDLQYEYESKIREKITGLKEDFERNRVELDALLGDVKLYQDKMTNKAVSEMSAHYYDKSKFERNSYFFLTIVSTCIIIFSVYTAFVGVNSYYNQYVSTESCDKSEIIETKETIIPPVKLKSYEECMRDLTIKREATQKYAFNYLIFRLSFSLLLFLAVIYASRIAMRAYSHWRQSENMYLKLNTLSPFIGSLDKSVRNDVHLSLVPDYFSKDAGMVENSKNVVKDLPTNISNIAIKAIEQAGSTIGSKLGSDKESKNSDSESSAEKGEKSLRVKQDK
nr:hypothetical protein [Acinetobacter oleivorans]